MGVEFAQDLLRDHHKKLSPYLPVQEYREKELSPQLDLVCEEVESNMSAKILLFVSTRKIATR